ncbi:MAG: hypothetical protein KDI73_13815, partial [Candidatus Competibacteraceae bacterium]|nr:hypothetical protein [Candidatus Competibacteraceae bacterium]
HSEGLRQTTETLRDCVGLFRLSEDPLSEPRHAQAFALATEATQSAGAALAKALCSGAITEPALFASEYEPIAGTQPQKYHTPFDHLCDELLPPIQEPASAAHPWICLPFAPTRMAMCRRIISALRSR